VKFELIHVTLHSLATEHRIAPEFGPTRERLGARGSCETILHELAHGLLLGGVTESQQIIDRLLTMPARLANAHEISAWRIELHVIERLGGLNLETVDLKWLPSTAKFRGKSPPSPELLTRGPTPAEHGVAAWLERIVRDRAMRIVEGRTP